MADNPALLWRATLKRRLIVTASLLGLWSAGIQARLFYLQVVRHDALTADAQRQQLRRVKLPGRRGEILDRNGHVLARSVDMPTIKAYPNEIDDPEGTVRALCAVLECSVELRAKLNARLSSPRIRDYSVARHVPPDEASRIEALHLKGVGFLMESRRFYPKRELAAHVLGYVDYEENGKGGIEGAYDKEIRGDEGTVVVQQDLNHIPVRSRVQAPPTIGASVELTIDEYIQDVAERELLRGLKDSRAIGGSVVIQRPETGEVLGLANLPTFNPNRSGLAPAEFLRNRAVASLLEPGSVIKMVTAAAALEQKVVTADEMIDVSGGQLRFGNNVIHDTHPYKSLSFTEVIVKSSNVGASKVGLRLGRERLTEYLIRFGFGRRTSPEDFPAESGGILHAAGTLSDGDLARVSMGYTIGVTPLQLAAAVSSIANGGELIEPRVVRALIKDGVRQPFPKKVLNRTVAPNIAAEVTAIMEGVVERGTGQQAQIENYKIAGKTGTATKAIKGGYSKTDYNASFVGFVPSRNPAYTIVVVLDTPRGKKYYGGDVSAPIFRRIAEQLLRHDGIKPSLNAPPPVLVQRAPEAGREVPASGPARSPVVLLPRAADSALPDVIGLSARDAVATMVRLGVTPKVQGTGVVVDQLPAAGTPLVSGATVRLLLARESPGRRSADATTQ